MSDYRLVYISENRLPAGEIAKEIDSILEASRKNNSVTGITGALMFSSGLFVQVLEGEQVAVETTFERIQHDRRHGDIQLLEFVPAPKRTFTNWSMAYAGRPEDATAEVAATGEKSGFDPRSLDGQALFEKLRDRLQEA